MIFWYRNLTAFVYMMNSTDGTAVENLQKATNGMSGIAGNMHNLIDLVRIREMSIWCWNIIQLWVRLEIPFLFVSKAPHYCRNIRSIIELTEFGWQQENTLFFTSLQINKDCSTWNPCLLFDYSLHHLNNLFTLKLIVVQEVYFWQLVDELKVVHFICNTFLTIFVSRY